MMLDTASRCNSRSSSSRLVGQTQIVDATLPLGCCTEGDCLPLLLLPLALPADENT